MRRRKGRGVVVVDVTVVHAEEVGPLVPVLRAVYGGTFDFLDAGIVARMDTPTYEVREQGGNPHLSSASVPRVQILQDGGAGNRGLSEIPQLLLQRPELLIGCVCLFLRRVQGFYSPRLGFRHLPLNGRWIPP